MESFKEALGHRPCQDVSIMWRGLEDLGRAAGFTRHSSSSQLCLGLSLDDGSEAKLHGEAFQRFIRG